MPWRDVRGEIRFTDVTFGYDRNQPVLRDVSLPALRLLADAVQGIPGGEESRS